MLLLRFFSFWAYPLLALMVWGAAVSLQPHGCWRGAIVGVLVGLLLWTLIEYGLHRILLHWRPRQGTWRRLLTSRRREHRRHPRDPARIPVAPQHSLPGSALMLLLFVWAAPDLKTAAGMISGLWAGLLYYELVHYRIHRSKSSGGALWQQRRGHFYNHFVDDRFCFGVTSPLWDWIFGTYRTSPGRRRDKA